MTSEKEFASRSMTDPSGRVKNRRLHKRFSKMLKFLPENLRSTQQRMNKMRSSAVNFTGKSWSMSYLTMDSFTTELVSNASAQLFPDNKRSSFTNFWPEQLNLEGLWEVATSEITYPSMYQNVTERKFMFFEKITFKVVRILLSGTWSLPLLCGFCWSHEHSHSRETQWMRKVYHS